MLGSLLFGIDPIDAITLLGVGAMLVAAASLPSSILAHKATWVDPMVTMRSAEFWTSSPAYSSTNGSRSANRALTMITLTKPTSRRAVEESYQWRVLRAKAMVGSHAAR